MSGTAAEERLEALLAQYAPQLGRDSDAYGNHVRRVFGLVAAQRPQATPEELDQVAIAAVFHDIAIWLDDTFDYLDPSRDHATDYLAAEGLQAWAPRVTRLVMEHHKLRPVKDDPLVEAFRRADLCDLSFGLVRPGIPRGVYRELAAKHPICGFQQRLVQFSLVQLRKDPRHPLPMMRW